MQWNLNYKKPELVWNEALPLGNEKIGAMVQVFFNNGTITKEDGKLLVRDAKKVQIMLSAETNFQKGKERGCRKVRQSPIFKFFN